MPSERARLAEPGRAWRHFGPYLSERAWGTVREDYSQDGDAWSYFPFEHAHLRTYRWSEDGLGGVCDDDQILCLAFAFWNERDPILKERIFGLTGPQGNHGEDAKEYWWYLDSTPTHSWMAWRYKYPQAAFPYGDLLAENQRRGKLDREYELVDTGIFEEDRYFDITAEYAKAGPDDLCVNLHVRNAGPEAAPLHVLPTLWYRNTWSWEIDGVAPTIAAQGACLVADHPTLGTYALAGDGSPQPLSCDNESNAQRLWGATGGAAYPKDGINDHVVSGEPTVNPAGTGSKAALWYRMQVPAGQEVSIRLRLSSVSPKGGELPAVGDSWERAMADRAREADEFYAELAPPDASADEVAVMRQAFAGMLWSKQFFHYDVSRWLDGDPTEPAPPESRRQARNSKWGHLDNHDVISMPDTWEYPWYASWDLAFHCVTLANVSPGFAKAQLLTMCREWYMHPSGQLPAYEWDFGDANPPVQAWAALRVFEIDGSSDFEFLRRIFAKLVINFTWWVNRKDEAGNNVFEGGFLGLDNIGPINRSAPLPVDGVLEQADGTSWMAMYCLNLLDIALVLAKHDRVYEDLAVKFFEHFAYIAHAVYRQGLWDDEDGYYYDILQMAGGERIPFRVRSVVGLLPLCATTVVSADTLDELGWFAEHFEWFVEHKPEFAANVIRPHGDGPGAGYLLSIVDPERLRRVLPVMLSEDEFLSPFGLRALSQAHKDHPFTIDLGGISDTVDYEPGESTSALFGGNSNWRGPIWFPVNYLLIEALRKFHSFLGDSFTVECPTGSGQSTTLEIAADVISRRLVSIFLDGADGRRPVFGDYEKFQSDAAWHGLIPFHEYFHGDTAEGLGASHQTGWTGLVADLICRRR
ncbi:MAG: MGH1-like glycoside hydrolase domain-containing protein [Acidimicrobiales bacterium]